MIDPQLFADKQFELAAEFGKYVFDHPEVDDILPDQAHVYFQIDGEEEFNQYSRELAERQRREEGAAVVLVRIKGLAPPQGSRLIDPVIEPTSAVA
jgi:hypothetical protein